MHYDLFNGDADGILSLHQLRLAEPRESQLITGLKREVKLLDRVKATSQDSLTVLDISLDRNRSGLIKVLDAGAEVTYFDHHYAGEIPDHNKLQAHINTNANVCTGLLVDRYLKGQYRDWAIAAAYGDNLFASAASAAKAQNLTAKKLEQLESLGTLVNYNGYGETESDTYFRPIDLYQRLQSHVSPFTFIEEEPAFEVLKQGYSEDLDKVQQMKAVEHDSDYIVYQLPNEAWARRVAGVWGNLLARTWPDLASVVLREQDNGNLKASIRAPLNDKRDADTICRQFTDGGGRAAAAGVGHLSPSSAIRLLSLVKSTYRK